MAINSRNSGLLFDVLVFLLLNYVNICLLIINCTILNFTSHLVVVSIYSLETDEMQNAVSSSSLQVNSECKFNLYGRQQIPVLKALYYGLESIKSIAYIIYTYCNRNFLKLLIEPYVEGIL